jgi:hypothetical protein
MTQLEITEALKDLDPSGESEYINATRAADILAHNPAFLPQFFAIVRTQRDLILEEENQAKLRHIDAFLHFTETVLEDTDKWSELEEQVFTPETAAILLDECTGTQGTETAFDKHIHAITDRLFYGLLNARFEKSGNWHGALAALHTLAIGALSDVDNLDRIQTWLDMFIGEHPNVLPLGSIANIGFFLAHRDPSVESEDNLHMGMDINNALSTAAQIFGKTDEYAVCMRKTFKGKFDKWLEYRAELKQYVKMFSNVSWNQLFYLIRSFSLQRFLNSIGGDKPYEPAIEIAPVSKTGELPFPQNVAMRGSKLKDLVLKLTGSTQTRERQMQFLEKFEKAQEHPGRIVPFSHEGIIGYVILPKDTLLTDTPESESHAAIAYIAEHNLISEYHKQADKLTPSEGLIGVRLGDAWIFVIPKTNAIYNETVLDMAIPISLRRDVPIRLGELLLLKTIIARDFNQSLTTAGIRCDLSNREDYPGVFDAMTIKLQEPGTFKFSITVHNVEQAITGTIALAGGSTGVHFDKENTLPLDISTLCAGMALKLFQSRCCLPHGLIPTIDEGAPGEERGPAGEIPAGIVHIGAVKADGRPGEHTLAAQKQHALDVYGLEIPPEAARAETLAMIETFKGVSLVAINADHRARNPDCLHNVTWRKAHETGKQKGPAVVLAPQNIFNVST